MKREERTLGESQEVERGNDLSPAFPGTRERERTVAVAIIQRMT